MVSRFEVRFSVAEVGEPGARVRYIYQVLSGGHSNGSALLQIHCGMLLCRYQDTRGLRQAPFGLSYPKA